MSAGASPIRLRPVVASDVPTLFRFQSDPEGNALASTIARDLDTFNATWVKILTDPVTRAQTIPRAILLGDELAGVINVFKRDGQDTVGYWIAREHWGKGIASRALALLLEEVSVRPLIARAARHNAASIRVLTRNGFMLTGYQFSPGTERFVACEWAAFVLE